VYGIRSSGVVGAVAALALLAVGLPSQADGEAVRCHSEVSKGVLPTWARAGFSGPRPRIPHVLGRSNQVLAIVFGYPLRSPPAAGRSNKILWVPKTWPKTPAPLWIRAQRLDGARPLGAPIRKIVPGGPGPSIVDLPQAGCWRVKLSWSGRTDELDLAYGVGG
jgi:hypothetical protein